MVRGAAAGMHCADCRAATHGMPVAVTPYLDNYLSIWIPNV